MNKCIFCDKNNMLKKSLLYKGKYWKVYLANNQDYIGRLIITTNKHIASLDNCDENYLLELFIIIKNFKNKLSKKLGIEHFNYSYLMNSFTKYDKSLWHVHIHMIPRTSKIIISFSVYIYRFNITNHFYERFFSYTSACFFKNIFFKNIK